MKKIIYFLTAIILLTTAVSCEDELAPSQSIGLEFKIEELSPFSYPSSNTWTITDKDISSSDYKLLKEVLSLDYWKDKSITLRFPNLTKIDDNAFTSCINIISFEGPNITEVGEGAFKECTMLEYIDLHSATIIGSNAFYDCTNITNVNLSSAESIGTLAFSNCSNLKSINLPKVTNISSKAFYNSNSLEKIALATNEDTELELLDYKILSYSQAAEITLTTGIKNKKYINGSTISIGNRSYSYTFKDIIIVGDNGDNDDDDNDDDENNSYNLSDFSSTNYPQESNTWIILDNSANYSFNFSGLQSALNSANNSGREIELEFPNIRNIPSQALTNCDAIKTIEAPKATKVESLAFYNCDNLESIDISSAYSIEYGAFSNCESLESVDVNSNYYKIADGLLLDINEEIIISSIASKITSVSSSSVKTIQDYALNSCELLTSIQLPNTNSIGDYALYNCTRLSSLEIASEEGVKLQSIGKEMLSSNQSSRITLTTNIDNREYINYKTLTVDGNSYTFKKIVLKDNGQQSYYLSDFSFTNYPEDNDTWTIIDNSASSSSDFEGLRNALNNTNNKDREIKLEFPNITNIPSQALSDCNSVKTIEIPKAKEIGYLAFYNCKDLETIEIPSASSIDYGAFSNCELLDNVDVNSSYYKLSDGILYSKDESIIISSLTSKATNISNSNVKAVMNYALSKCKSINSIRLPNVTTIGNYALFNCGNLTALEIASNKGIKLENIGSNMLSSSQSVNITLTIGVDNKDLINYKTLKFNESIYTFKDIIIEGEVDNNYYLSNFSSTYYPKDSDTWVILNENGSWEDFSGLRSALNSADNNNRKINLEFPNLKAFPDAEVIDNYYEGVLNEINSIKSITAPKLQEVGTFAFYKCINITDINISNIININKCAFCSCDNLTNINIRNAYTIEEYAFGYCENLINFEAPNLEFIGNSAFTFCFALTSLSLPNLETLSEEGLFNCNLSLLNIPNATTIEGGGFSGNENLQSVYYNHSYFTLQEGILYDINKTKIITSIPSIPNGTLYSNTVKEVCVNALCGSTGLNSIDLPNANIVGILAFQNCNNASVIELDRLTKIEERTFTGCSALEELQLARYSRIESLGTDLFDSNTSTAIDTEEITLYTGSTNNNYVYNNTLTVGEVSYTFNDIIYGTRSNTSAAPKSTKRYSSTTAKNRLHSSNSKEDIKKAY